MSPRISFLLALAGVLAAGVPLLWLTAPAPAAATSPHAPSPEGHEPVYMTLRFTGNPTQGTLRLDGEDIATLPAGCRSPWETELSLPSRASLLELEAELHWPEGSPEQAVTINLEPLGKEARRDTQWTGSNGSLLHAIFTFTW